MRPVLFTIGGLTVHGYGLAVAVGFAVGVVVAARQARRVGLDRGAMLDLMFWILVGGILGSRVAFVLLNIPHYMRLCASGDCFAALRIWDGGLVFYGGVLAALGAVVVFCRRRAWALGMTADVLAPAVALGHAFGRLGCFLAGCCWGKPVSWGVLFPSGSLAFAHGVRAPVHPTQLYEAAGELGIYFILIAMRPRQRFQGATALLYAMLYAGLRLIVEMFRGDRPSGTAQAVSAAVLIAAGTAFVVCNRRP